MESMLTTLLPFVIIVVIFAAVVGKNAGSPLLVLKAFKLSENEEEFLKIDCRVSGVLSWIFSLCGIDPVTSLSCNKHFIKFEETAIRSGKRIYNIPLVAVTCVSSGISKPFGLFVLGVISILCGIIGTFYAREIGVLGFYLILGAVFLFLYSLKKNMFFAIYNGGDKPIVKIHVKKSIIEGQTIDELKYESATSVLNKAVLNIHYILSNTKDQNNEAG
jgi:hypothetical protein